MKRFLVFMGHYDFPRGGFFDFVADCESKEAALEVISATNQPHTDRDWAHIVDLDDKHIEVVELDKNVFRRLIAQVEELGGSSEDD